MYETFGLAIIEIEHILTEDIKNSKPFELCMKSLQQNDVNFKKLHNTYMKEGLKFRAESKLKCEIQLILNVETKLVSSLRQIG